MNKILITGASGLLGTELSKILQNNGYEVSHLVRKKNPNSPFKQYLWNPSKKEIDLESIKNTDAIIHLAGAGIADKKWTPERKKEIIDSRVIGSEFLIESIIKNSINIKLFVSASAVGYYGLKPATKAFIESDVASESFLGNCCLQWESACSKAKEVSQRLVTFRIGVVLSEKGGALPKLIQPIKYFVGSPLGSGQQIVPWIHVDDLCRMFLESIKNNNLNGVYNAVAPKNCTNQELTKSAAKTLKRPLFLPNVPSFLIKILFGEMASLVLEGAEVSADKILKTGFKFQYPKLEDALKNLLEN